MYRLMQKQERMGLTYFNGVAELDPAIDRPRECCDYITLKHFEILQRLILRPDQRLLKQRFIFQESFGLAFQ